MASRHLNIAYHHAIRTLVIYALLAGAFVYSVSVVFPNIVVVVWKLSRFNDHTDGLHLSSPSSRPIGQVWASFLWWTIAAW